MCPFAVRVPIRLSLAVFLGSMITCAVGFLRRGCRTFGSQLGKRICLSSSKPTPFNGEFRIPAAVSLLRHHVAHMGSHGILTVSAIGFAVRLILRTRLTPGRLALPGKPWSFGGGASHPPYRYLYLHLLFRALQQGSSLTFAAHGMLPYQSNTGFHGFGSGFDTRLLSTPSPSTSELLRTL